MSLKIAVCVKQVLDINDIKIDKEEGTLITEGVKKVLNSDDANALEEALKIKDDYDDTHITVVTIGPLESKYMLMECLALGADEAVLIADENLEYYDTLTTAMILAEAIKKIGNFDIVLTGRQAIGGETAQVGPQLAEILNIPHVSNIINLAIPSDMKTIIVNRTLENINEKIQLKFPCLLTAVKELNKPRSMSLRGILEAKKKEIKIWSVCDFEISVNSLLSETPTMIVRTYVPFHNKACKFIYTDNENEAVKDLLTELKSRYIVK